MVQEILHDPEHGTVMRESLKDAIIAESVKETVPRKDVLSRIHSLMNNRGHGDEVPLDYLLQYTPPVHYDAVHQASSNGRVKFSALPSPVLIDIIDLVERDDNQQQLDLISFEKQRLSPKHLPTEEEKVLEGDISGCLKTRLA